MQTERSEQKPDSQKEEQAYMEHISEIWKSRLEKGPNAKEEPQAPKRCGE